jgi:hypothetical protein
MSDKFIKHERWGMTWWICSKHPDESPQSKKECPHCSMEEMFKAIAILSVIISGIILIVQWILS